MAVCLSRTPTAKTSRRGLLAPGASMLEHSVRVPCGSSVGLNGTAAGSCARSRSRSRSQPSLRQQPAWCKRLSKVVFGAELSSLSRKKLSVHIAEERADGAAYIRVYTSCPYCHVAHTAILPFILMQ